MKKLNELILAFSLASYGVVYAHHGVASLGTAGLEGPGSPLETSSSLTLPEGKFLGYLKLDYAKFKKYTPQRDNETDSYTFWMYGLGYGLKSYLSLYLFLPYDVKKLEDNSYNTANFGDVSLMAVLGFKYDDGFQLIPEMESLDDLMDWHFTIYGGFTLPTGNPNMKDKDGNIDPGMSIGFGKPTTLLGFSATKQFTENFTLIFDINYLKFFEYEYENKVKYKFGDEFRINTAFTYKIYSSVKNKFRLDLDFEINYLNLGRDKENGIGLQATGGDIIYTLYGFRAYYNTISFGAGVKIPTWTNLNEESLQQGAEGKEKYRIIFTFSTLF